MSIIPIFGRMAGRKLRLLEGCPHDPSNGSDEHVYVHTSLRVE